MKVHHEERKNKTWKSGNPYLDDIIPNGPLMTLEKDASIPFVGRYSGFGEDEEEEEEEEEEEAVILARPCPREMIRDTPWEEAFPPPLVTMLDPPYRK